MNRVASAVNHEAILTHRRGGGDILTRVVTGLVVRLYPSEQSAA